MPCAAAAAVLLQGGQWFHYDDSFVQPTKLETVVKRCQADGYLFFYANSAILGGHTQQETQQ
jgi:ubiquitin C-terminal hydrolase